MRSGSPNLQFLFSGSIEIDGVSETFGQMGTFLISRQYSDPVPRSIVGSIMYVPVRNGLLWERISSFGRIRTTPFFRDWIIIHVNDHFLTERNLEDSFPTVFVLNASTREEAITILQIAYAGYFEIY